MKVNSVRNNAEAHRFEMDTPSGIAVADYRIEGNVMTMFHTEVPIRYVAAVTAIIWFVVRLRRSGVSN